MKTVHSSKSISIPKDVTIKISSRVARVKGPRGKLIKSFKHFHCDMKVVGGKKGKELLVELWFGTSRQIACISTVCAHIKNMIIGVTKGFERRMRFVYAHFPINASVAETGKNIEIRNFLGEKILRKVTMSHGVKVARSETKDEIILTGNDIEKVSQSAALIHQVCLVKKKDIRKFLDGIYVSEKNIIGDRKLIH